MRVFSVKYIDLMSGRVMGTFLLVREAQELLTKVKCLGGGLAVFIEVDEQSLLYPVSLYFALRGTVVFCG